MDAYQPGEFTQLNARAIDGALVTITTYDDDITKEPAATFTRVRVMSVGHSLYLLADSDPGPAHRVPVGLVKTLQVHGWKRAYAPGTFTAKDAMQLPGWLVTITTYPDQDQPRGETHPEVEVLYQLGSSSLHAYADGHEWHQNIPLRLIKTVEVRER